VTGYPTAAMNLTVRFAARKAMPTRVCPGDPEFSQSVSWLLGLPLKNVAEAGRVLERDSAPRNSRL
jgi:hypothetical protein